MAQIAQQQASSLVGKVVKAKLSGGDDVEGELYAYDPASATLALSVPTEPGSSLKHWVIARGEHVRSVEVVEGASAAPADADELVLASKEAINKREKKAIEKAIDDARHVNTDVTNQVQNIFNALRKTMPCEWKGADIVVMDLVTIRGPQYTLESCEGADESSLSRVRKVVSAAVGARARPQERRAVLGAGRVGGGWRQRRAAWAARTSGRPAPVRDQPASPPPAHPPRDCAPRASPRPVCRPGRRCASCLPVRCAAARRGATETARSRRAGRVVACAAQFVHPLSCTLLQVASRA